MGGSTLQCAQAQQHVITINWTTLIELRVSGACVFVLRRTVTNHDPYNYVRQFSPPPPPLEKSCIRPCLQLLMLIFWCIWRENTRAGQVAAGWIDGACGPDMLKFTGCRGPDRQSSRAGFGTRAGLCRPLIYTLVSSPHTVVKTYPVKCFIYTLVSSPHTVVKTYPVKCFIYTLVSSPHTVVKTYPVKQCEGS